MSSAAHTPSKGKRRCGKGSVVTATKSRGQKLVMLRAVPKTGTRLRRGPMEYTEPLRTAMLTAHMGVSTEESQARPKAAAGRAATRNHALRGGEGPDAHVARITQHDADLAGVGVDLDFAPAVAERRDTHREGANRGIHRQHLLARASSSARNARPARREVAPDL